MNDPNNLSDAGDDLDIGWEGINRKFSDPAYELPDSERSPPNTEPKAYRSTPLRYEIPHEQTWAFGIRNCQKCDKKVVAAARPNGTLILLEGAGFRGPYDVRNDRIVINLDHRGDFREHHCGAAPK